MKSEFQAFLLLTVSAIALSQRYFIASPNVFRLGFEETISVQVWQTTKLEIYLQDQKRTRTFNRIMKTFKPSLPETVKMKISEKDLPEILGKGKLYFFLVAKGTGIQKEIKILLDMRSGTVFIQTDKPIYCPKDTVKYRVLPVGPDLRPMRQKVMLEIMNPQGIRVRRERDLEVWKRGFASKEFDLGDIPVHGTWTITASFSHKNAANSSTTFVVKEYVLPTFLVRIMPPPYVAQTDKNIPIRILAKYSYGKDVVGTVRLKVSVIGEGKDIVISDERTMISGEEVFSDITVDKLIGPKEIPSFPVGKRLKVFAAVTERATGTTETASDSTINLVKSPYTISFAQTVKYFKPALSFRVQVNVHYPNRSPAKNIKLRFSATDNNKPLSMKDGSSNQEKSNDRGEAFFTLNIPRDANDASRIKVVVETDMANNENSKAEFTLEPYRSTKRNYVLVRPPASAPKVGSRTSIKVLIPFHSGIQQLNYLVLGRGRIVDQGVVQRNIGVETSFILPISADMAPNCRIVVYYEREGEIAADSVLMDVEDAFNHQVKIETNVDPKEFRPALNFMLTVHSKKNSLIGLLGVDQSVYYLRNESRITKKKIFSDMNRFDLGCGVGSGKDNQDVFYKAGLSVISNSLLSRTRSALACVEDKKDRKRRSLGKKESALLKKCCKGRCCKAFIKSNASLEKKTKCRSLKSHFHHNCWQDFYQCCRRNFEVRGRSIDVEEWIPSPDEIDNDETQVTVRQFFPETWIWMDTETKEQDKTQLRFTVPDSITTWEVTALAVNSHNGFGMSNTLQLQSTLNVFVHVKMPYSVQRREQVAIYAVVYNFNERKTRVNLFLKGHTTFCSVAKPGQRSPRISVIIDGKSAVAVPFLIIPLTIGKIPVEFQAFTSDKSDRIIRELLVVPEGVPRQQIFSISLDPQGLLKNKKKKDQQTEVQKQKGNQINTFDLNIPQEFVKDSELVMVYVTGNLMGAAVEDIINGGLNNLIRLPTGCGEQTMMRMAPTVYVLRYLHSIKNGVTSQVEKKAYSFIRSGYNHQLKWRRTDDSYSVWGERTPPSTWLTAFVNKVFCQARQFIKDDIDENIVCESLQFIESIQASDGSFPEGYAVRHREMIGGVKSKLSLTAFVLISLMECTSTCRRSNAKIAMKAASFLEHQIPQIKTGYLMSLVSYSLSLANSPRKLEAYNKVIGMLIADGSEAREAMYIKDGGPALSVEATSYTLLTMMALKESDSAGPLVIWLTKQRNSKGSFYSTQDTVIALQALSEYSSKTAGGDLDLSVRVTSAKDKDIIKSFRLNQENALVRQQADISGALPGRVFIDTKGKGTAQLQIVTTFNKPSVKGEQCGYLINITTKEGIDNKVSDAPDGAKIKKIVKRKSRRCKRRGKNKRRKNKKKNKCRKTKRSQQKDQVVNELTVDVCASHKFSNGSSMTIMDVGLLTGFRPDEKSLKLLLSKDQDPRIDHYEINDRSVVFYLGKISHQKKTCIKFLTKRTFHVGEVQPVPVNVYDYYEPGDVCTEFYGPKKNSQLLGTICDDDDECQCSQGTCADEPTTNTNVLKKKACLQSDFVFIGLIIEIEDQNSWQRIALSVRKIYKKGKVSHSVGGKLHIYKTKSCAYPDLKDGREYLVMLKDGIKYVIDKDAFILAWPNIESKKTKLRNALDEISQGDICDKI